MASTAERRDNFKYYNVKTVNICLNHSSFDEFVKELNPDVVLFDRFMSEEQFGWRVAENVPNAIRILDSEDLHALRKSREEALKKNIPWSVEFWKQHDMTKREVASILRCDLSLIISSFEKELLESIVPNHGALLLHLPFMVDKITDEEIKNWPVFEERRNFVFIGFGGHSPNVDAIEYLKKHIWPLIRTAMPDANLNIYGGNLPEKTYQLHNKKEGFLIQGWAECAAKVISSARVLLAPLRFGAGQKGKLLDAMLYGTPSITTTIGAEAMHSDLDWNGKICDDPKAFAKAAVETYQDKSAFEDFQKNGLKIIGQNFEKKSLEKSLRTKLGRLQKNLLAHRDKNFIGALLQHQTMASTKFMSKWIEEKNQD